MRTLMETIKAKELVLGNAPKQARDVTLREWEEWFAKSARYFRQALGELIIDHSGFYCGTVGDHSLDLNDVYVVSNDGYRSLLMQWSKAAHDAVEFRAGAVQ